jgi:type IV pilus assembly protein PilW
MFNHSDNNPGRLPSSRLQHGSSLIELLVGIAVGLMVVTAAMGSLVVSRITSTAVSDQLELQQQANTAMRIMTAHLRETNTRDISLSASAGVTSAALSRPPVYPGSAIYIQPFTRDASGNDDFGLAYSNPGAPGNVDCLGSTIPIQPLPATSTIFNRFSVDTVNRTLRCNGTTNLGAVDPIPQPIIADVQRLRVLYLVQTPGTGLVSYVTQAALPPLTATGQELVGMELCLELVGAPRANATVQAPLDCDGLTMSPSPGSRATAVVRQTIRLRAVESEL